MGKHIEPKKEYAVLNMQPTELKEIISDNLGDETLGIFDLQKINIPSGGGEKWKILTLTGEEHIEYIDTIIAGWQKRRVYWQNDSSGGKPDCYSNDGKIGIGNPGGICEDCPLSQWGEHNEPPACRELRQLFLVEPDAVLPSTLSLPPTSLSAWKQYTTLLTNYRKKYWEVITRLGLKEKKSGGNKYSTVSLQVLGELEPEEKQSMRTYMSLVSHIIKATGVEGADYRTWDEDDDWEEVTDEDIEIDSERELSEEEQVFQYISRFGESKKPDWDAFWAAASKLGKTKDEIHSLFEVESTKDVPKEVLQSYLEREYDEKFAK